MAYYTRLTYNSQNWQLPSGLIGKCGNSNSLLWEFTAGFGFEEWYRNPNFQINDENGVTWQYGYWQCFKNPNNHSQGVYKDFTAYTRKCKKEGAQNIKVAFYTEIRVLSKTERDDSCIVFSNEFAEVRSQLQNLQRRDGRLIGVNNHFDNQPGGFPQLNIKFRLKDEKYLFPKSQNFKIERGGFRFGLYEW
jgi:hypothetical protein